MHTSTVASYNDWLSTQGLIGWVERIIVIQVSFSLQSVRHLTLKGVIG